MTHPYDFDDDPAKHPHGDREGEDGRELEHEPDEEIIELEHRVVRHADGAEEAELAEEDILEIADLDDEDDARKGEGPDA